MFRVLIAAAAIAAGFWALLRRKGGAPRCTPKLDTTIVIGGSAHNPTIIEKPDTLCASAKKPDTLSWMVSNKTQASQRIDLTGFKKDNKPNGPRAADDIGDNIPAGGTKTIRTDVKGKAKKGDYKYNIELNGALAVDPDVVIWEEGGP